MLRQNPEYVVMAAPSIQFTDLGGVISAYMWDNLGGGLPMEPILAELGQMGVATPSPPSEAISRMDAMRAAWADAGLEDVESRVITVRRTFADFEEFWMITTEVPGLNQVIATLTPEAAALKTRTSARLPAAADGTVSYDAWANAIKGRKPRAA